MTSTNPTAPSSSTADTQYELIRYTEKGSNYRDKFLRDASTKETIYFCSLSSHGRVTLHQGDKDGPELGTAHLAHEKDLKLNIHLFHDKDEETIILKHEHHKFPSLSGTNHFTYNEKNYHWKESSELIEDESKTVIARYHANRWEGDDHVLGKLEIEAAGKEIREVVVLSWLVVLARGERHREESEAEHREEIRLQVISEV